MPNAEAGKSKGVPRPAIVEPSDRQRGKVSHAPKARGETT
jgi:hypothetical protein